MATGFPALMIQQPEDPLKQVAQIEQIRSAAQQQELTEVQLREARLNQNSQTYLMQAYARNGGDMNKTYADAASSGQVTPQMLLQFRTSSIAAQTQLANLSKTTLENLAKSHELAANELEAFKSLPVAQRTPDVVKTAMGRLAQGGVDISTLIPQFNSIANDPSDQNINTIETGLKGEQWLVANEKAQRELSSMATPTQVAEQRAATLRATQAKADLDAAEAAEKGSPLTRFEHDPSQMSGDKLPAAIGYLQGKIADPTATPSDVARASKLLSQAQIAQQSEISIARMKKSVETAVTQGSPTSAAQLLVAGDATLSQLKARGSTPEFIAQTLSEANRISGGTFNAQKAEADFDVAKSTANVAFFGSSKSLIDKGGTLDQLAAIGKDIPQGQIPIFNSIADAAKAATGSGPIAQYAAVALGVADDYAKVMGGGQGSDTSRVQALKLISEKASPEQREAAIEGIRNAVASQTNSRIGNNAIMKRMYGDVPMDQTGSVKASPPAGATHKVMGRDGKLHYTNAAGTVDYGVVP